MLTSCVAILVDKSWAASETLGLLNKKRAARRVAPNNASVFLTKQTNIYTPSQAISVAN